MCRGCGEFVNAYPDDGRPVPLDAECPHCGGRRYEAVGTGTPVERV